MQYPNYTHRPSLRVDVVLNGDPGIRDVFRISLDSNWSAFFEKVGHFLHKVYYSVVHKLKHYLGEGVPHHFSFFFFKKVRTALCPELTPEFTDSIRDARGAQIFETQVLNDGEVLYFCPRFGFTSRTERPHEEFFIRQT